MTAKHAPLLRAPTSASLASIAVRLADPHAWQWRGPVESWLDAGFVLLYGPSGTGKSFTAVDWALRVASGYAVGPYASRQGTVVYIAAEDRHGIERRMLAAAEAMGAGYAAPVFVIASPGNVHDPDFAGKVIETVRALAAPTGLSVAMVVVDTLRAACSESLNDDKVATKVTAALLAIAGALEGAAVVAVHHSGKDEARGAGGSKILFDRADTVIKLDKTDRGAKATSEKQRNGPSGVVIDIELIRHRVSMAPHGHGETLVVGSTGWAALPAKTERPERPLALDAQTILAAIETVRIANSNACREDLRKEVFKRFGARSDNAKKSALTYGLKTLMAKGLVDPSDPIVSVRNEVNSNASNASNDAGVRKSVRNPLKGDFSNASFLTPRKRIGQAGKAGAKPSRKVSSKGKGRAS